MQKEISCRTVNVTRYVAPLREGGSMPAITEADDGFLYALKFRGVRFQLDEVRLTASGIMHQCKRNAG